jgi:hypothetical protein
MAAYFAEIFSGAYSTNNPVTSGAIFSNSALVTNTIAVPKSRW